LFNIDNKISVTNMACTSKLLCKCTFAQIQQTKLNSSKILHQQCTIYWQSKRQIWTKSAKINNGYSGFGKVTPKHFSFRPFWMMRDL